MIQKQKTAIAEPGDRVKINYIGKCEGDTIFDSSLQRDPLEFIIGTEETIPGFDEAITGMSEGETIEITVPPEHVYGLRNEELVVTLPRSDFPDTITPNIGMVLQGPAFKGMTLNVKIIAMDENTITFDGNHHLAGKPIDFEIHLLEILSD